MAARGDLFGEGPGACPFVALEQDRDRRSDLPDYRHRCFAEPTPAPRAIAHQEAYCLSPNFPACPVFQDWAVRAAARPVPVPAGYQGHDAAAGLIAADAAADVVADVAADEEATLEPSVEEELPAAPILDETADDQAVDIDEAEPAVDYTEQLGAFDATQPVDLTSADAPAETSGPEIPVPDRPYEADAQQPVPAYDDEEDLPAVPPFLAGRPSPPAVAAASVMVEPPTPEPRSSVGSIPSVDRVRREDVVPSWGIDGRFGAQPDVESPRESRGGLLTTVAVVAILALGVLGVIFLPGLLAGGPARTTAPTFTVGPSASAPIETGSPLASPTQPATTATPAPTGPTISPEPVATPRLYRIRSGDTLARIARRNDITVADILAANPDIPDANHIEVGQVIIIPLPLPTAAP